MEKKYANYFKALSDENRLKIMKLLIQGETCGCTMINQLPISQPTLSYHLKGLTDANLITAYKEGNWKKHHVNMDAIDELIDYLIELKKSEVKCNL